MATLNQKNRLNKKVQRKPENEIIFKIKNRWVEYKIIGMVEHFLNDHKLNEDGDIELLKNGAFKILF